MHPPRGITARLLFPIGLLPVPPAPEIPAAVLFVLHCPPRRDAPARSEQDAHSCLHPPRGITARLLFPIGLLSASPAPAIPAAVLLVLHYPPRRDAPARSEQDAHLRLHPPRGIAALLLLLFLIGLLTHVPASVIPAVFLFDVCCFPHWDVPARTVPNEPSRLERLRGITARFLPHAGNPPLFCRTVPPAVLPIVLFCSTGFLHCRALVRTLSPVPRPLPAYHEIPPAFGGKPSFPPLFHPRGPQLCRAMFPRLRQGMSPVPLRGAAAVSRPRSGALRQAASSPSAPSPAALPPPAGTRASGPRSRHVHPRGRSACAHKNQTPRSPPWAQRSHPLSVRHPPRPGTPAGAPPASAASRPPPPTGLLPAAAAPAEPAPPAAAAPLSGLPPRKTPLPPMPAPGGGAARQAIKYCRRSLPETPLGPLPENRGAAAATGAASLPPPATPSRC